MPVGSVGITISLAGISIQSSVSRSADGQISHEVSLPAGQSGALTTRTGDTVGEATLGDGHGIQTADVVDVYWSGGVRYGVTVGTVAGNVVPLTDSGAGDVYPAQGTTLIVAKQVTINTDFDGDDAVLFAAFATARAHADFQDSGSLSLEAVELAANEVWWWASSLGQTNPLTGNAVDTVQVSNGTTAVATFKLGILYDSTP